MKKLILAAALTAAASSIAWSQCTQTGISHVVGGGYIDNEMGDRCTEEKSPCSYDATNLYEQWFLAVRNGNRLVGWKNCPEVNNDYCRVTYDGGDIPEVTALFALPDAPMVRVRACTSGILPGDLCTPYVGKAFALEFSGNQFRAVGWDNRIYTGSYTSTTFSGKSDDGELMTAVQNGSTITIALYPKGYSGCSSSAPNCVVSLVTELL